MIKSSKPIGILDAVSLKISIFDRDFQLVQVIPVFHVFHANAFAPPPSRVSTDSQLAFERQNGKSVFGLIDPVDGERGGDQRELGVIKEVSGSR